MKRPLSNRRPIGPFAELGVAQTGRSDVTYYKSIDIETNSAEEFASYSVRAVASESDSGSVMQTNRIVINGGDGAIIDLYEAELDGTESDADEYTGDAGVKLYPPGNGRIGIEQANKAITNIVIE